ncbi:hypothetical protein R1flu_025466 [Riccia fluitans]|uniref:PAR1 protein n=1 Tax=Riccia fluitans TaxID=41844 RepID=A0ABD1XXV6_9MARC
MEKLGSLAVFFVTLLLRQTFTLGNLMCEDLSIGDCAFAVSSTGARCVLEKSKLTNGETTAECQTSIIMAAKPLEWIETDDCIKYCGLERISYGLSTDALMEKGFTAKLCSSECQNSCPNIVDLYLKLAAGEGLYLPHICLSQRSKARRLIADPIRFAHTISGSNSNKRRWSPKKIAPGPLEAEAYSPTTLPANDGDFEVSANEISPTVAPESADVLLREVAALISSPPSLPIPVIPGPLPGVTASINTERYSVEDLENEFTGQDY